MVGVGLGDDSTIGVGLGVVGAVGVGLGEVSGVGDGVSVTWATVSAKGFAPISLSNPSKFPLTLR